MGLFTDIVALFQAGYGWVFVTLLVAYELFAPHWLDRDTALAPIVRDVPEQVEETRTKVDETQAEVTEIKDKQESLTKVTVAQAHVLNGFEGRIDAHEVEDDLVDDNDKDPADYLADSDPDDNRDWQYRDHDDAEDGDT